MDIRHSQREKKFFAVVAGKEAILKYSASGKVLDFYHVFVPEEARGQGLAEKLALEAFRYAEKNGFKVIPSCPYIKDKFLQKHHEFGSLIS